MAIISIPHLMIITCLLGCSSDIPKQVNRNEITTDSIQETKVDIPDGAQVLIKAYPQLNLRYADNRIIFADSSSIIYDDNLEKDCASKMDNADIEDMFSIKYDREDIPTYLADGGRCRCEEFFRKVYGNTKQTVSNKLVRIDWFGQKLPITTVNSIDKQLKAVAKELSQKTDLIKYLKNSSSFNWRMVRGTNNRLSAHSYGISVDINTKYSDYWLWKNPKASETDTLKYANRIPKDIITIFEKYGFIWGGHWYHYDTMHFEYRPEILINAGVNVVIL